MKILVLGATGFVGSALLPKLKSEKLEVTVLARSEIACDGPLIKADFLDYDFGKLPKFDVVFYLLSPPMKGNFDLTRYQEAFDRFVSSLSKDTRFIGMSGASIRFGDAPLIKKQKWIRPTFKVLFGKIVKLKDHEAKVLENSSLRFTMTRSGMVKEVEGGQFNASLNELHSTSVSREQVVQFLIAQISSTEWIRKAPFVSTS